MIQTILLSLYTIYQLSTSRTLLQAPPGGIYQGTPPPFQIQIPTFIPGGATQRPIVTIPPVPVTTQRPIVTVPPVPVTTQRPIVTVPPVPVTTAGVITPPKTTPSITAPVVPPRPPVQIPQITTTTTQLPVITPVFIPQVIIPTIPGAPISTAQPAVTTAPVVTAPVVTAPAGTNPPIVVPSQTQAIPAVIPPVIIPIVTSSTTPAAINTPPLVPVVTAPLGYVFGAHKQYCPDISLNSQKCSSIEHTLTATGGKIQCNLDSECCMCNSIVCGNNQEPCNQVIFGDSSAYGVKDIQIIGNKGHGVVGAIIDCQGIESCRGSTIIGEDIQYIHCKGDKSCEGAKLIFTDPKPGFELNCEGLGACNMLQIEINFSGPPAGYKCKDVAIKDVLSLRGISCNNDISCEGMEISINNEGCEKVVLDAVKCTAFESCNAAIFNFIGDIDIAQCECGPSCTSTQGLDKCFQNIAQLECPTIEACMNIKKNIINPLNAFELKCGDTRSCQHANFNIELNTDANKPQKITYLKGFFLSGDAAARGAIFAIENNQGVDENMLPITVEMELIECSGSQSCVDTTFIIPETVSVAKVICSLGACQNCLIQKSVSDPGMPCDPTGYSTPTSTTSTSTTSTTTTTTTTTTSTTPPPVQIPPGTTVPAATVPSATRNPNAPVFPAITSNPNAVVKQSTTVTPQITPVQVTQAIPVQTQAIPVQVTQAIPVQVTQAIPVQVTQAIPAVLNPGTPTTIPPVKGPVIPAVTSNQGTSPPGGIYQGTPPPFQIQIPTVKPAQIVAV